MIVTHTINNKQNNPSKLIFLVLWKICSCFHQKSVKWGVYVWPDVKEMSLWHQGGAGIIMAYRKKNLMPIQ